MDIDPYFKSQLHVEDPSTESQYSVYRMDWVNLQSKRTTEILLLPWAGFELTASWLTVQHVTTELSPLSKVDQ